VIASQSIEKVVRAFVKGLQEGDIPLLMQHFTTDAVIQYYEGGRCETRRPADYFANLSRFSRTAGSDCRIEGIDTLGDVAHAYVSYVQSGRAITDYLALQQVDGAWKIASRSFHADPLGDALTPGRQAA
jgi:ketosteroid isomerase-like protein